MGSRKLSIPTKDAGEFCDLIKRLGFTFAADVAEKNFRLFAANLFTVFSIDKKQEYSCPKCRQFAHCVLTTDGSQFSCWHCRHIGNDQTKSNAEMWKFVCSNESCSASTCLECIIPGVCETPSQLAEIILTQKTDESDIQFQADLMSFKVFLMLDATERKRLYREESPRLTSILKNWGERCNIHSALRLIVGSIPVEVFWDMGITELDSSDLLTEHLLVFVFVHLFGRSQVDEREQQMLGKYDTSFISSRLYAIIHEINPEYNPDVPTKLDRYLDVSVVWNAIFIRRFDVQEHTERKYSFECGRGGTSFRAAFLFDDTEVFICDEHGAQDSLKPSIPASYLSFGVDEVIFPASPATKSAAKLQEFRVSIDCGRIIDNGTKGDLTSISRFECPRCSAPCYLVRVGGWSSKSIGPEVLCIQLKHNPPRTLSELMVFMKNQHGPKFPLLSACLTSVDTLKTDWDQMNFMRNSDIFILENLFFAGVENRYSYLIGLFQLQIQSHLFEMQFRRSTVPRTQDVVSERETLEKKLSIIQGLKSCRFSESFMSEQGFLSSSGTVAYDVIDSYFDEIGFSEKSVSGLCSEAGDMPCLGQFPFGKGSKCTNPTSDYARILSTFPAMSVAAIIAYVSSLSYETQATASHAKKFEKKNLRRFRSLNEPPATTPGLLLPAEIIVNGCLYTLQGALTQPNQRKHYNNLVKQGDVFFRQDDCGSDGDSEKQLDLSHRIVPGDGKILVRGSWPSLLAYKKAEASLRAPISPDADESNAIVEARRESAQTLRNGEARRESSDQVKEAVGLILMQLIMVNYVFAGR